MQRGGAATPISSAHCRKELCFVKAHDDVVGGSDDDNGGDGGACYGAFTSPFTSPGLRRGGPGLRRGDLQSSRHLDSQGVMRVSTNV